jgi:hypothetical protein
MLTLLPLNNLSLSCEFKFFLAENGAATRGQKTKQLQPLGLKLPISKNMAVILASLQLDLNFKQSKLTRLDF